MDFFAHQDRARKKTWKLVLAFAVSLLVVVLAVDAAAYGIASLAHGGRAAGLEKEAPLLTIVTLGVLGLVSIGSFAKTRALAAAGGSGIAEQLGGRLVHPGTADPSDRRLVNVVEEMAIASGLPVPQVFVLEHERQINAFAAGLTPGDAVVAVTRGALEKLSRDELQGVVAHEFSHIMNGDMRINVRMIGLLHGILLLAITGRIIVASLRHVRTGGKKGGGVIGIILLSGAALWVLGSIGLLIGRIWKAGVNRQREFLADASAVQFTRNPQGLAGALRKLLGHGTRVKNEHAPEMSHLFFGNPLRAGFSLLGSHPPLEKRLDVLDPGWRDRPAPVDEPLPDGPAAVSPRPTGPRGIPAEAIVGFVGSVPAAGPERAAGVLSEIPQNLKEAAEDGFSARAVVVAAIADRKPEVARLGFEQIRRAGEVDLAEESERLHAAVASLPPAYALSLVLLAVPTLRSLSDPQRREFLRVLDVFVRSDGMVTLREHALYELTSLHLGAVGVDHRRRSSVEIRLATSELLAVLARSAARTEVAARAAYEAGCAHANLSPEMPVAPPSPRRTFSAALRVCRSAIPPMKQRIVEAAAWTVSADGTLSPTEGALLRLVVDSLDCPLPALPLRPVEAPEDPAVTA